MKSPEASEYLAVNKITNRAYHGIDLCSNNIIPEINMSLVVNIVKQLQSEIFEFISLRISASF